MIKKFDEFVNEKFSRIPIPNTNVSYNFGSDLEDVIDTFKLKYKFIDDYWDVTVHTPSPSREEVAIPFMIPSEKAEKYKKPYNIFISKYHNDNNTDYRVQIPLRIRKHPKLMAELEKNYNVEGRTGIHLSGGSPWNFINVKPLNDKEEVDDEFVIKFIDFMVEIVNKYNYKSLLIKKNLWKE